MENLWNEYSSYRSISFKIIKHMYSYFISRMFTNIVSNSKNLRQPKCPTISISLDNITAFSDNNTHPFLKSFGDTDWNGSANNTGVVKKQVLNEHVQYDPSLLKICSKQWSVNSSDYLWTVGWLWMSAFLFICQYLQVFPKQISVALVIWKIFLIVPSVTQ